MYALPVPRKVRAARARARAGARQRPVPGFFFCLPYCAESYTAVMDEETLNATPTVHGRSVLVRIDDDFDEESPEAIDALEIFGS